MASNRSKNITGLIIKVDGGRALTSSWYTHYKGIKNMNIRFESDAEKAKTWLGGLFSFGDGQKTKIPMGDKELKKL